MKRYIAVPHQYAAHEVFDTGAELGEYDRYLAGDHDYASIIEVDTTEPRGPRHTGHQSTLVNILVDEFYAEEGGEK